MLNCASTQEQFEAEHWDVKSKGPIRTYLSTQIEILLPQVLPNSTPVAQLHPNLMM
jgi:hypothetical protein